MTTIAQQILMKKNSYNKSKKHSIFKISVSCDIEHSFLSVIQILLLTPIWKTDVQKYFLLSDVPLLSRSKSQWLCTIISYRGTWTIQLHRTKNQYHMSFVFWSYLVGSLSLCFLSVYYLCFFCNTYRKRSSKFFLITPLTHLCRLPNTEWYVHMCFKILFPASTPVLLCYILIICCISET